MADFSTGVELEVGVSQRSIRSARDTIESELGDLEVGVDAVVSGADGGGRQSMRRRIRWERQRTEDISDILDVLLNMEDSVADAGDGGGGFNPLRILRTLGQISIAFGAGAVASRAARPSGPPQPTPTPTAQPRIEPKTDPTTGAKARGAPRDRPAEEPTAGTGFAERLATAAAAPIAMTAQGISGLTGVDTGTASNIATGLTAGAGATAIGGPAGLATLTGLTGLSGSAFAQQGQQLNQPQQDINFNPNISVDITADLENSIDELKDVLDRRVRDESRKLERRIANELEGGGLPVLGQL